MTNIEHLCEILSAQEYAPTWFIFHGK
jgi:hypothetical protein